MNKTQKTAISFLLILSIAGFILSGWLPLLSPWERSKETATLSAQALGLQTAPSSFFYLSGEWPVLVRGVPVIYHLRYQKGPPQNFVAGIVAVWPGVRPGQWVRLWIDGPSSPEPHKTINELENCAASGFTCFFWKAELLAPLLRSWGLYVSNREEKIETVQTPNSFAIKVSQKRKQGSRLRYYFFNDDGKTESIKFDSAPESIGISEEDQKSAAQIVENLGMLSKISMGSQTLNQALVNVDLKAIDKRAAGSPIEQWKELTKVYLLLLGKISVDPNSEEHWFHLAGVTLLLTEKLNAMLEYPGTPAPGMDFPKYKEFALDAWKQNLEAIQKYIQDIAPGKPVQSRIKEIDRRLKQGPASTSRLKNP